MPPRVGDILIISHWDVWFDVARVGAEIIGRTNSKRDALLMARNASANGPVWFVNVGGTPVRLDGESD